MYKPTTRTAVTRRVQHPPGLSRWMDVYALADPVPNGPTRIETSAQVMSVKVWNCGAPVRPYVLLGKSRRFRAAGCSDLRRDGRKPLARQAAARNAGWLARSARRMAGRSPAVDGVGQQDTRAILRLWTRHQAHVPVPFSFPSWFWDWGPFLARSAILLALIVLAAWAAAALLRWPWSAWVRADRGGLGGRGGGGPGRGGGGRWGGCRIRNCIVHTCPSHTGYYVHGSTGMPEQGVVWTVGPAARPRMRSMPSSAVRCSGSRGCRSRRRNSSCMVSIFASRRDYGFALNARDLAVAKRYWSDWKWKWKRAGLNLMKEEHSWRR